MGKNGYVISGMEMRNIDELIPYVMNSRTHSEEQIYQISASIREFGFLNPIIVDSDGGVIAGHGRILAAKKLGLPELPCVDASHLSKEQKRAYIIADNKLALNAGWDDEILRSEIQALQDDGLNLDLTGFSEDEISSLFGEHDNDKGSEETKDITDETKFILMVEFYNERQLQSAYEEYNAKGFPCKILE